MTARDGALRLKLTTAPTKLPVTMDEVRAHVRVEASEIEEEAPLNAALRAATSRAELYTRRALITQTWTAMRDHWPHDKRSRGEDWWDGVRQGAISQLLVADRVLELPKAPLQSVTHIKTYDDADAATTFAATKYYVDTFTEPGRIVLRDAAETPSPTRVANGIEIEFVAGYGDDYADVPEDLRQGILRMTLHLYENRGECTENEAQAQSGATGLWAAHRIVGI